MNNDLISREALKLDLAKEIKTNDMGLWLKILLVIDNAPTVEPCKNCDGYEAGYNAGLKDAEPQVGWVRKEDVIHSIAKQYREHNELVPIWLSIADIRSDKK